MHYHYSKVIQCNYYEKIYYSNVESVFEKNSSAYILTLLSYSIYRPLSEISF